jgi:hypothetical protein
VEVTQKLLVVDGWTDASTASGQSWSTINPWAKNYMPVKRSINRKGGAQFTYSFWIQVNDVSAENVAGKTILLRGDHRVYSWIKSAQRPASMTDAVGPNPVTTKSTDVLIKCPRIRFGDTYDSLVVEFNTLASPDASVVITSDPDPYSDATLRHNLLKLIPNKWVLMTFSSQGRVGNAGPAAGPVHASQYVVGCPVPATWWGAGRGPRGTHVRPRPRGAAVRGTHGPVGPRTGYPRTAAVRPRGGPGSHVHGVARGCGHPVGCRPRGGVPGATQPDRGARCGPCTVRGARRGPCVHGPRPRSPTVDPHPASRQDHMRPRGFRFMGVVPRDFEAPHSTFSRSCVSPAMCALQVADLLRQPRPVTQFDQLWLYVLRHATCWCAASAVLRYSAATQEWNGRVFMLAQKILS